MYQGKTILVTGGTGSIGREIVKQLLAHQPKEIRVFSRDEGKHVDLLEELRSYSNIRCILGDVRDKDRVRIAMKQVDIVFHTAALKHVHICENNPHDAFQTNVMGTQNVVQAAVEEGVSHVIGISTDKAASPSSTLGLSKLMMERIIQAANHAGNNRGTICASVRFGNVAGSRGSVIPFFLKKAQRGEPLPITHLGMTRYMMSIKQASKLCLRAGELAQGGETFLFKMPRLRLADLAEVLRLEVARQMGNNPVQIEEVGIRPGEKIHEDLLSTEESETTFDYGDLLVYVPVHNAPLLSYWGTRAPRMESCECLEWLMDEEGIREIIYGYQQGTGGGYLAEADRV